MTSEQPSMSITTSNKNNMTTHNNKPFGVSGIMNYPDLDSDTIYMVTPASSYHDFENALMRLPFKKRKNYKGIMITCKGVKTKVKWTGKCFMVYVPNTRGWAVVVSDETLINKICSIKEKLVLYHTIYEMCVNNDKTFVTNYVDSKIVSNHTGNSTGKARKVVATKNRITRKA